ncbi:MAG: hypothetical protein F2837_04820 [Actinobacteria bacterium]|uniref:Unannotated protein n=1 Tax=freshwater metagenome TaxID=449393 RepID=A0A6J7IX93_9ZZZZ|nr:hypothetical protein [Actinomycetota bacterium]
MIDFDASSLLLQWATGGLLFVWVTTRRREVSLGYGWLMRGTYALMAFGAFWIGVSVIEPLPVRDFSALLVGLVTTGVLVSSILRRRAGVAGQNELVEARSARVAEMTGIERAAAEKDQETREFDPRLDLIAPVIGFVGVIAAGLEAGGPAWLAVARFVVGALFLGAVTDAMLLGHWYLVQPGLARGALLELVRWTGLLWIPEVALLLVPTGMISAINGTIDDGYGGLLTWFWIACVVTTIGLIITTRLALKERAYSAVMAATGLLYLAILTAFGIDLVARALLS